MAERKAGQAVPEKRRNASASEKLIWKEEIGEKVWGGGLKPRCSNVLKKGGGLQKKSGKRGSIDRRRRVEKTGDAPPKKRHPS